MKFAPLVRAATLWCSAIMAVGVARAQTASESRGEYLVNAVMGCDGCHTPGGPQGMQRRFSGGSQLWDTPEYRVRGSNITQDKETGVGAWTQQDIKRLLVEGVRPNGVPVSPQMPFPFYKGLTAEDLDAVAAYVRTVPAINNAVEPPLYKATWPDEVVPGAEKPATQVPGDPVRRGLYLANAAHCMECHARKPDGSSGYHDSYGKGGHVMSGPWGKVTVSNITSHPTKGVGAWTDAEIKRALTHGVSRDGRRFAQPMQREKYYAKMTDEDLTAVVLWVRTLPPLE